MRDFLRGGSHQEIDASWKRPLSSLTASAPPWSPAAFPYLSSHCACARHALLEGSSERGRLGSTQRPAWPCIFASLYAFYPLNARRLRGSRGGDESATDLAMGQRTAVIRRSQSALPPMPCERCLALTSSTCRRCHLFASPLCDTCHVLHTACGRCMGRSPFLPTPRPGGPGVRIFSGDAYADRMSPPPWPHTVPLPRGLAAPTGLTYLGHTVSSSPRPPARPPRPDGPLAAPGLVQGSPSSLAIVARGSPAALAIVAVSRAVTPSRHDWRGAKVRALARLLHLNRLIPHARVAMAAREARLRNGSLRAAFALDRIFAFPSGHQPCEWCGLPTARRCATCEDGHHGVICMDCAFVFLGCTVCWLRFRGHAPPPADADALAGWYPR